MTGTKLITKNSTEQNITVEADMETDTDLEKLK